MNTDKYRRLRRLGVVKGARNLKSAPRSVTESDDQQSEDYQEENQRDPDLKVNNSLAYFLPGGQIVPTDLGSCFVLDNVYPLSQYHGTDQLGDLLSISVALSEPIVRDKRFVNVQHRDLLFLDTETTGLPGAGTIAFMVGVAFYDYLDDLSSQSDALVVRQYFLRDHGDEAAMLLLLSELLDQKKAIVTFNGKSFDLPLLDNRYLMTGLDEIAGDLLNRPHIDLLPPARRLWSRRLSSCSLGSLEANILGVKRTDEDIPGWAIPGLYFDYLRTGDLSHLKRVFYHNQIDMLSMVTLMGKILRQFSQPTPVDHPLDLVSLGRWQLALGYTSEAEENLRLAASLDLPMDSYHQTLHLLGTLLKRDGRRSDAVPFWQQIAVTAIDDVTAHIELAKAFEWHLDDLDAAKYWTKQAISLCDNQDKTDIQSTYDELMHRLNRLESKLSSR